MNKADLRRPFEARRSGPRLGREVRSDNLRAPDPDIANTLPSARNVLSREEIEALLRPDLPEPEPQPAQTAPHDVPDLDGPKRRLAEQREQAERLVARMALALRREAGLPAALTVAEVSEAAFREAVPARDSGAAFACFGDANGDVTAVIALSGQLASALIEAACGADPSDLSDGPRRHLTELDADILATLLGPLARFLPGGHVVCLETRSAFAVALVPPGRAVRVELDMRLEGMSGRATLAATSLVPSAEPGRADGAAVHAIRGPATRPAGLTAILTARVASLSVPVSRLSNLRPGDTLLLGVPADEPVQLLSGGRMGDLAAEGEIGRKGGRMAVRITRRGPAIGEPGG